VLRTLGIATLFAILSAACVAPAPSQAPTPEPSSFRLATTWPLAGCAGIGFDGSLQGDPSDPRVAWIVVGGRRVEVVWPTGFQARFDPRLEILDATDTVVLREGDPVTGGCTLEHEIYVAPPFE
jgi:hypothetical protein